MEKILEKSLKNFWDIVIPMTIEKSRNFFDLILHECVKKDFQKKFIQCFNSKKPITERFFIGIEKKSIDDSINEIFEIKVPEFLEIQVLWGNYKDPLGFLLKGHSQTISNLFVSEGDAIAQISSKKNIGFVFLDGHRGDLFKLKTYPKF